MVVVKKVHYIESQATAIPKLPTSKLSLLIQQENRTECEPQLSFILATSLERMKVAKLQKENQLLAIDIECDYEVKNSLFLPLDATQEIKQLTSLLFTYYASKQANYPIDQVVDLLINKLVNVNSELVANEQSFLSLLVFMTKNVNRSLSNDDFSRELHISYSTLLRMCKKFAGLSPKQLFNQIRHYEARRLLFTTLLTNYEIAEQLGFKNASHFSTAFKKMEGISPHELRKQQLSKKEGNNYE
ncbi:helix-turn-helix transcriptional regulator [Enterococcus sp. BWT-B8]|uniref:helix-turn-helix domain-containing protein n=1 Tax=Enterococcus sp. BWT-B8 TaxID=2885157 RepID=UPI001E500D09|nr:response regulator transcription factor [Enterococcus sp. BWT-B8]MCB5951067.1 helix-turn-helix transcriptional regulator [Enterococcus sp. BWT-B8]